MTFVLAHRPHQRLGQEQIGFRRFVPWQGKSYLMDIPLGGYTFKLDQPLIVNVEEGRIRGRVKAPIEFPIPEFNAELRAYVMPDGRAVRVRGDQLIPTTLPPPAAAAAKPLAIAEPARSARGTAPAKKPAPVARVQPARVLAGARTAALAARPKGALTR
jgi:hypothetical protein